MIIAYRTSQLGSLRVANVFLSPDLSLPIDGEALACFRAWDETYIRLRTDRDSTRIYAPEDLNDQKLMELNTATLASTRALPKKLRNSCRVYTIATDFRMGVEHKERCLWTNLPNWAQFFLEAANGDIFSIATGAHLDGTQAPFPWTRWSVGKGDLFLHTLLFWGDKKFKFPNLLSEEEAFQCTRLGPLLARGEAPLSFALKLNETDW